MMPIAELMQTADATAAYRERSSLDVARADSTAQDGTVASFTKNNTLVVSATTFYPMYPVGTIYVQHFEEQIEPEYLPR